MYDGTVISISKVLRQIQLLREKILELKSLPPPIISNQSKVAPVSKKEKRWLRFAVDDHRLFFVDDTRKANAIKRKEIKWEIKVNYLIVLIKKYIISFSVQRYSEFFLFWVQTCRYQCFGYG
ncbi:hypothetical protein EV213_112113 [Aureibacillus halotolerans]|uniref:Uncharacterized protein n=1 Tax=Aureibacillus halotolerans TaxID=1508390 RepID=A0A4R6TZG8_9BACI|nr:hypothetical protein EV213_112113 [Aureibacillus halotolerans]